MLKFEYCKPVTAKSIPTGPDWIHEVKYDGYRGRVVRDGKDVKLYSRSGLDWSWRFPWIVETALKIKQQQFIVDGEICVLDVQGISDFDALHSNRHNEEAQLYAFDLVAMGGEDLRDAPLLDRKGKLDKLLRGRAQGIFVAPFERGEIGPDLFTAACRMRLEGIVSKHQQRRYRARTCAWVKVKNRTHPAYARVMDQF
jgi:bifunctional non-homologous end joining protein LigD